jgi:polysaccharide export outer membrane protein
MLRQTLLSILCAGSFCFPSLAAPYQAPELAPLKSTADDYILGPNDQLQMWALGAEELSAKPFRIDPQGNVDLPLIGQLQAGGRTVASVKTELTERLKTYLREPQVTLSVAQYQSQPVSIVGAVNTPGTQFLQGRKTLLEVLSMSGGLRPDAGSTLKITRRKGWGKLELEKSRITEDGEFSVAEINVKSLMAGERPGDNIAVMPHDVVSVPRAEMVYVIGEVKKAGGFVLGENESISVIQALSMAEGMTGVASPSNARILRAVPGSTERQDINVNVKMLLARDTKAPNVALQPNDILFIPSSMTKRITNRAIETGLAVGTGLVIWRR